MIWPNFFIVGAQNSGTTSLYAYLKQHPDVFMPALKEPHYFAQITPSHKQRYLRTIIHDEAAYLGLFRKAQGYKAIGEASPSYLWDTNAALRIRDAVPHAKIIILLRDPVERAYSHYLMDVREGRQDLSFREALQQDWKQSQKGWSVSQLYVELGLYAQQVQRYLDVFGSQQVLILLFDELTNSALNGKSVLANVLDFLGLSITPLHQIDTRFAENGFAAARWPWARRIAGANWVRRAGQLLVPVSLGSNHTIKRIVYQRYFVKAVPKPAMDERAGEWLRSIYDPDLRALEAIVGHALPELRRSWQQSSRVPASSEFRGI
ncbi:MAG: sulfotransferase [Deltaproteobacteria bacterium]|nr:sulfotransferase [Deltaproteobacteria bacterium]